MNLKKYFLFLCVILFTAALSLLTESCADDPTSLGLKFLSDTTGVKIFDSYIDTMMITSTSLKKRTNTSGSSYMIIGNSGTYNSKSLLKFNNLPVTFDSSVIISATLTLYYANYYYPLTMSDSLGQIGFDIFKIQQNYNFNTITYDSIVSNSFGNVSQGNYTGVLATDTQKIVINLNTSMIYDWLAYAEDTTYPNKNFGVVLSPNAGSSTIKGFISTQNTQITAKPSLQIILTKNGTQDTITTQDAQSFSLIDGTLPQGNETFSVQAGIGYVQIMKFDLSHIPSTATINDVLLYFTIDSLNTKLSTASARAFDVLYVDTSNTTTGSAYTTYQSGSQYIVRLVSASQPCPFQRWLDGQANYGLQISPRSYGSNLDLYTVFNVNSTDHTKKPHVVIKYTPRITPK